MNGWTDGTTVTTSLKEGEGDRGRWCCRRQACRGCRRRGGAARRSSRTGTAAAPWTTGRTGSCSAAPAPRGSAPDIAGT